MKFVAIRGYSLLVLLLFCLWGNHAVYALNASIGPDGCNAQAVHMLGYTGHGVGVGVITQEHCLVTHEAFFEKDAQGNPTGSSYAHYYDSTGDVLYPYEPYWHDTAMAGIVASRGGYLYPNEIGVAPGAAIYNVKVTKQVSATDPNRLISSYWIEDGLDHLISNGCRIAVTGIQVSGTADGSSQYSMIYDYYAYTNDIILINAAGNGTTSITIFGDAFNGLTTAGLVTTTPNIYRRVGSVSNPGPTADGRRKPDIAAPAQNLWVPTSSSDTAWTTVGWNGETSWAGPHAAGVAALLVQYANQSTETDDSKSEVIKAVIVNSAFPNIQDKSNVLTTGQLWHPQRGYGRIDAMRALQTLNQPKVATGTSVTQSAGWAYRIVTQKKQNDYYQIYGTKNSRLTLTLTWHRKINKLFSSYSEESTPFNLNLSISEPNGTIIASEADGLNNLRRADILLPVDGFYQVLVANSTDIRNRDYALAFEILPPLMGDFDINYIVDVPDLAVMTSYWLEWGCNDTDALCRPFDIAVNGQIDLQDIAALSTNWLTMDMRYYPVP